MLSKHWDHHSVYPLKLLITRGHITLTPKEATIEKENKMIEKRENKNNEKKEKIKIEK